MKKTLSIALLALTISAQAFACPFHKVASGSVAVGKTSAKVGKSAAKGAYKVLKFIVS